MARPEAAVKLDAKLATFDELWQPKIVGQINYLHLRSSRSTATSFGSAPGATSSENRSARRGPSMSTNCCILERIVTGSAESALRARSGQQPSA